MWKLTIEDDEAKQTSLPLTHDEYGVGRDEANAIRLTDRNVSRKHATITRNAKGWIVADLESYNGTYVNGLRVVGEQHVAHGDIVQLGDYRLELVDDAASEPSVTGGVLPVHQRPDRLVVVVGPTPGTEYPLDREHFTVGRAEDAHISVNHSSVSRFHSEIFALGNGRYEIIDKGSANGIRINGYEVKRGLLEPGDAVELGDVRMRFVGRGKIFRAGADQSQQLAVVDVLRPPSGRPLAHPTPQGSGMGKFIIIGAVLGLLGIVVLLVAMRAGPESAPKPGVPTPGVAPLEDDGVQTLEESRRLFEHGDLEHAHNKLRAIGEASTARQDPKFHEIAAAWADQIFKQVDATEEALEKRAMLHRIVMASDTVDADRRNRAGKMLKAIEDTIEGPIPDLPKTFQAAPTAPWPPATSKKAPPDSGNGGAAPVAATDYEGQRAALLPKLNDGSATRDELNMLRAVCNHLKDVNCRNAAGAALKKMPK